MIKRLWLVGCGAWSAFWMLVLLGTRFEGKDWYLIPCVAFLPWLVNYVLPFLFRYIVWGDASRYSRR